jgi:outer membrane protein TolC
VQASGVIRALERACDACRARAQAVGAWPNPALVSQYQLSSDPGNHMLTFGLRQPLDFRGLTSQRREAAEDEVRAMTLELDALKREVRYQARRAFISLWLAQATVDGQNTELTFLKHELVRVRRRVAAGTLSVHEVVHAEFEMSQAEQSHTEAAHELERVRARLNVLFGQPVDAPIRLPAIELKVPVPADNMSEWIAEALKNRSEPLKALISAQKERRAARLAESLRFGEGEIDLQGGTAGPLVAPILYSAFSLQVPLWNDYRTEVAAHEAEAASQEARRLASESAIAAEVTDAWIEARQAAIRVKQVVTVSLALSEHALEKAEIRVAAGAGTLVEVLEAKQRRNTAHTARLKALLNYHLARLRLEEAAGR